MRRRHRTRSRKVSVFKEVDTTPARFSGQLCPTNLQEQKERFLKHGIPPKFHMKESSDALDRLSHKKRAQIRFDLFQESNKILEKVKSEYGDGRSYMEKTYGKKIDYIQSTEILAEYLNENNLAGELTVYWTPELTCSARMMWHGPNLKYNRPEMRTYSLIIKNSSENLYLREFGIGCLADHEIGTHFFRMLNDGLQPWFSDRKKFGLRGKQCRDSMCSEEGLAAVNTVINARCKYLWGAALLYYTACKASELTFKELFDHLETYIKDAEQRWKHVMRVKRSLHDPSGRGGFGSDQCYFEGAVEVLRNLEKIDFNILYSGKICVDEINRVRRLARMDCVRIPHFLRDIEKYKKTLRQIGYINGIIMRPVKKIPSHPCMIGSRSPPSVGHSNKRSKGRRKVSVDYELQSSSTPTPPPLKNHRQSLSCGRDENTSEYESASTIRIMRDESLGTWGADAEARKAPASRRRTLRMTVSNVSSPQTAFTESSDKFIYPTSPPPLSTTTGRQVLGYDDIDDVVDPDNDVSDDEDDDDDDDDDDEDTNDDNSEFPANRSSRLLARPQSSKNKLLGRTSWTDPPTFAHNMDYFTFVQSQSKS